MSSPAPDAPSLPSRQVVLLPDDAFFVRNIPVATGADASPVGHQVELALESLAPFPLAQMYYGYWSRPGVDRALVFGAYRRRFPAEETEGWATAEWVTPRFAALLGGTAPAPGTTWVLQGPELLTVVYFADGTGVPTLVRYEAVPAETSEGQRAFIRDRLLRELPGSRTILDVPQVEVIDHEPGETEWKVRGGPLTAEHSFVAAEALDVRDKAELTGLRRARARERWLWRGLLAGIGLLAACAVGELALVGVRFWQGARLERVAAQAPIVNEITTANTLAARIDELTSRRLRVFEMIARVDQPRPDSILFLSTSTSGLYTLDVQGQTTSASDLNRYQTALRALPGMRDVKLEVQGARNNITTFRMTVTFGPEAFSATEVSS